MRPGRHTVGYIVCFNYSTLQRFAKSRHSHLQMDEYRCGLIKTGSWPYANRLPLRYSPKTEVWLLFVLIINLESFFNLESFNQTLIIISKNNTNVHQLMNG